ARFRLETAASMNDGGWRTPESKVRVPCSNGLRRAYRGDDREGRVIPLGFAHRQLSRGHAHQERDRREHVATRADRDLTARECIVEEPRTCCRGQSPIFGIKLEAVDATDRRHRAEERSPEPKNPV